MSRSLTSILPTLLGIAGLLSYAPQNVEGHAYMMAPVSRNLYATTAFVESSYPDVNYCPHCFQSRGPMAVRTRAEENTDPVELAIYGGGAWPHLGAYERGELASNGNYFEPDAIAVRHGICGDPEQTAAEGSNRYGKDNSNYPVLETYAEGSVMEMKVVMSTYHWGHLEFFICNSEDMSDSDGVVNQGCFNMHPLDRAEDDEDASPIDPKHRGRYYVDPSCRVSETDQTMVPGAFAGDVVTARYQLPEGLTCSRCIVQMVYYTGNSCKHPGYDEFDPPSWPSECAPAKENWISTGLSMCGDGDSYPEEFWNCADVEITSDGTSSGPSPSPEPETEEPTPTPVAEPTYMPHYTEYEPTAEPAPEPSPTSEPTAADAEEPTPMPAYMPIDNTPVPTFEWEKEPTPEPTYELDGFEPTPQGEEPTWYDKPVAEVPNVLTLAPATFAPSVPAPAPDGDCKDPAGAFAQCGGNSYEGPNCCRSGWECTELADCYSQCRPIDGRCSEGWGQCGGNGWDGPTCCWPGAECLERNEWYSQCVPETHN